MEKFFELSIRFRGLVTGTNMNRFINNAEQFARMLFGKRILSFTANHQVTDEEKSEIVVKPKEKETIRATPEWHYYCPDCERSNYTQIKSVKDEMFQVTCSDCGLSYYVEPVPPVST